MKTTPSERAAVRAAELLYVPDNLSGIERRTCVRFPGNPESACRAVEIEGETYWPALVLDIAEGGVGLVLGRRFEPETLLHCDLRNAGRTFARLVRVVHAASQGDCWIHGCTFLEPLTEDELQALI